MADNELTPDRGQGTRPEVLAVAMILNRALTRDEERAVEEKIKAGADSPAQIAATLEPENTPMPWEALVFDALLGAPNTREDGRNEP